MMWDRVTGAINEFFAQSMFFGVALTILGYQAGLFCRRRLQAASDARAAKAAKASTPAAITRAARILRFADALANPLLIAIVFVILALMLFRVDYEVYRAGAQYISYLLTPATVCLAIPLYLQLEQLKKHWKAIAAGITAGVLTNLCAVFALSLLFRFTHEQYVTFLPKSITSAIGIGLSEELGGVPSVTVAAIILTGILGNIAAGGFCRLFRIREPVARGLAIGAASHAIGTAK
ncbi:MAG: LrgB family protein, partial [Clostridiales bacterium]|nr:LrgB family protein [Clostridiales bacterium]